MCVCVCVCVCVCAIAARILAVTNVECGTVRMGQVITLKKKARTEAYLLTDVRETARAQPKAVSVQDSRCRGNSTCTASAYLPVCARCCPRAVAEVRAELFPA